MNTMRVSILIAAAAIFAVACSSTDLKPPPPAPANNQPVPNQNAPAAPTSPTAPIKTIEAPSATPIDPLSDPKSLLARRSVYFAFDQSGINDTDISVLEAHGRYLVDHPDRSIRVEGNCDERGGREYNLALGQRRAETVRQRLMVLGVAGTRIETSSLGKEKPRAQGHDEASWAENRRADIIYK
jgi:peptidoglycan-associated lipoprotein